MLKSENFYAAAAFIEAWAPYDKKRASKFQRKLNRFIGKMKDPQFRESSPLLCKYNSFESSYFEVLLGLLASCQENRYLPKTISNAIFTTVTKSFVEKNDKPEK